MTLDDGSIFHSPLPMPDQDAACEVRQLRINLAAVSQFFYSLQLAAKLALESVRKEVENSSRGPKTGQGVHGGGKQAARGRGRGRRRGEQVSSQIDSMHHFWNLYYLYAICLGTGTTWRGWKLPAFPALGTTC